jgi:hypothetical protein
MKLSKRIKYSYLRYIARHKKRERYFVVFDPSPFLNQVMFRVFYNEESAFISADVFVNNTTEVGFRRAAVFTPEEFRMFYRKYKESVGFICL